MSRAQLGSTMSPARRAPPPKPPSQKFHNLSEIALIDMGDFIGGMLKYIRRHPVAKVTVAGGVAKMTKLAQGMLDVHSKRGLADLEALAMIAAEAGASSALVERIRTANTVAEAFQHAVAEGVPLGDAIARKGVADGGRGARRSRTSRLKSWSSTVRAILMGRVSPSRRAHDPSRPRKRR